MLSKQQAGLVGVDNFEVVKGKVGKKIRFHIHAKKCLELYWKILKDIGKQLENTVVIVRYSYSTQGIPSNFTQSQTTIS